MTSPVFPAGYPTELKKYGYPPPFPPGYPPEQYEKYGYPPRFPTHDQVNHELIPNPNPNPNPTSILSNQIQGYPVMFPWGPGNYIPIAGNVYNSGFNVNHSGSQSNGDVKVGNQN